MTEKNDLTLLNDDQQLQADIKNGVYSVEQVADIWRQTEDLSPQTNINARREIIALRNAGKGRGPIEAMAVQFPMLVNMLLRATNETQAAMMRDESKFAHLVAGAEVVAKSMEQLGTIAAAYEKIQDKLNDIEAQIADMNEDLWRQPKRHWWQFWKYIPNWRDHEHEEDVLPQEAIPTDDPRAEEARKRTIGSAWANRMPD